MRYLVNGKLTDLRPDPDLVVSQDGDRLKVSGQSALVRRCRGKVWVSYAGKTYEVQPAEAKSHAGGAEDGTVRAPIPGAIVEVMAKVGQKVEEGERLVVLEAMKMQQPLVAAFDGTVAEVNVVPGDQVAEGDLLIRVEPA